MHREHLGETIKNTEIERKFIIDALPPEIYLSQYPDEKIVQGYLANGPDGAVRVRRKGDEYFWTFKAATPGHAAERIELETQISPQQFEDMWPGTEGRRLEKTRYKIPFGDHTIELDIFEGDNAGHILAEVEFDSTANADTFQAPEWFGPEVTSDRRFGNASIAEDGWPA